MALLLRPVGAIIFGFLADKFGRRGPLMVDVLLFSLFSLLSGFCTTYTEFLVVRCLFGVAMGGEWGLGTTLVMETLPKQARGFYGGLLQQGYALGSLLCAVVYSLVVPRYGWRVMFYIGASPALVTLFIRYCVPESQSWQQQNKRRAKQNVSVLQDLKTAFGVYWQRALYCVLMMSLFGFLSHGSQDLYPTFLRNQLGFSYDVVSATTIIGNVGAICGGVLMGSVGQRLGRRLAICLCCVGIGGMIYPWVYSPTLPAIQTSVFFMQFFVQGAFGVVPTHLNELAPSSVRAFFPGVTYQLGTLVSAASAQVEAIFGEQFPIPGTDTPNYAITQAIFIGAAAGALIIVIACGPEAKDADLGSSVIVTAYTDTQTGTTSVVTIEDVDDEKSIKIRPDLIKLQSAAKFDSSSIHSAEKSI